MEESKKAGFRKAKRPGAKTEIVSSNPYRPDMKVSMKGSFSELHELNKKALSLVAHR